MNIAAQLIVVIGSPGSGKTYYMKNILQPQGFYVFDDFFDEASDNVGDMQHSKEREKLISMLQNGNNCAIADIKFSQKEKQEEIKDFIKIYFSDTVEVQWHCFKNNPDICRKNVTIRNIEKSKEQIVLIDKLSPGYVIPDNAIIMNVHDMNSENV